MQQPHRSAGLVTPYMGVWIETRMAELIRGIRIVTPYMGVWIETDLSATRSNR